MASSFVESKQGDVVVQGFKPGPVTSEPYVFVGVVTPDGGLDPFDGLELTPENAHILSEEIRKHAEFANSAEEESNV